MRLREKEIDRLVRNSLGDSTNGAIFRSSGIAISLNLPDKTQLTIEGKWCHMTDKNRLAERIEMLQHLIYEQYPDYPLPDSWAR